jgi:cyclopropane fatty-acyl-phospholipid synthase-like methyltransferase
VGGATWSGKVEFIRGNALLAGDYPDGPFDFVVSTELGEFLKNDETEIFYRNVHGVLAPGGVFCTTHATKSPVNPSSRPSSSLNTGLSIIWKPFRRGETLNSSRMNRLQTYVHAAK